MNRMSPRVLSAIFVTLATMGVVWAAGMVWGEHSLAVPRHLGGGVGEFETTGWAGRLILGPLWLPNRLVAFAAGIVCWCCWLRAFRIGPIPAILPLIFCVYGMLHAGAMIFLFSSGIRSQLGPGALLSELAFVAMFVVIVFEMRSTSNRERRAIERTTN